MKTNIALIGFMGTGKTAVGEALAARLGKELVETDALIVEKAGMSIPEIFNRDGEIAFRELEIAVIKEIAEKDNIIISCGGGVVLNKINIDRLRIKCIIINLIAKPSVIAERTAGDDERPLLAVNDRIKEIKELLDYRRPFYERAADIEIDTSELDIDAVVNKILGELEENAGNG